jgi:hypothetical protein
MELFRNGSLVIVIVSLLATIFIDGEGCAQCMLHALNSLRSQPKILRLKRRTLSRKALHYR